MYFNRIRSIYVTEYRTSLCANFSDDNLFMDSFISRQLRAAQIRVQSTYSANSKVLDPIP